MKKARFSEQDWVQLGLAELADKGSEGVKLEAICKAAGLTRGSFYHHFTDHTEFLKAMAAHWLDTQTNKVADAMDPSMAVAEQSAALTEAAIAIDYRLELGIRELARRMPDVERIVREADAIRLDVLTGIYRQRFALDDGLAKAFAFIEYAAFSGIILLDPDMSPERQQALAMLYDETVATALGPERVG